MLLFYVNNEIQGAVMMTSLAIFCFLVFKLPSLWKKQCEDDVKSDSSLFLFQPFSIVKRRVEAWLFLLRGPAIVQRAYEKAEGLPFCIDVPENRYVVVSSWTHIKEIDAAPGNVLSLQAAAKDLLQPEYTMKNFNWHDTKGVEGAPLIRTLRTCLTNYLPTILPEIRGSMSWFLDQNYDSCSSVNGTKTSPLYPMVIQGIAYSNALAFFGRDIARNARFMKAARNVIEQTVFIAEIVRLLPKVVSAPVGKLLSRQLNSDHIIFETLLPIVDERLAERDRQRLGHQVSKHDDCIQWVIESLPKSNPWSAERVVHELLALWFGSVHLTTLTACFAIRDLCLHPEYIAPLRKEIEDIGWEAFDSSGGRAFPLLDSFMKESARFTPVESVSTRRKALQPFEFSGGYRVNPGQWICTAARGMMSDPAYYTDPGTFHGFRFVDPSILSRITPDGVDHHFRVPQPGKPSAFTEVSDWQLWGTGKSACPGRYYASGAMKTMLGLLITKYDLQPSTQKASPHFSWRTTIFPYPKSAVGLCPRVAAL